MSRPLPVLRLAAESRWRACRELDRLRTEPPTSWCGLLSLLLRHHVERLDVVVRRGRERIGEGRAA